MDVDACCEYCYQYARVPFEVCWYCGDQPCYHHGRCCPLKPRPAAKAVVTAGVVDRDVPSQIQPSLFKAEPGFGKSRTGPENARIPMQCGPVLIVQKPSIQVEMVAKSLKIVRPWSLISDRSVPQWIVQDVVTGNESEDGIDVPNDDGHVVVLSTVIGARSITTPFAPRSSWCTVKCSGCGQRLCDEDDGHPGLHLCSPCRFPDEAKQIHMDNHTNRL